MPWYCKTCGVPKETIWEHGCQRDVKCVTTPLEFRDDRFFDIGKRRFRISTWSWVVFALAVWVFTVLALASCGPAPRTLNDATEQDWRGIVEGIDASHKAAP